jgi:KaiC/GvpD/RAD55 family RecA-like ATPase
MKNLITNIGWLDTLLPEGIVVPSSTLISGPGGTGKPLVEFAFVAAWLRAGGALIGIPLQYPSGEMVKAVMKKLYNIDMKEYSGRIIFVQFDPNTDGYEKTGDDSFRANMLKPEVWDSVIEEAEKVMDNTKLGTMIFGSALNLLLFSKTFKEIILSKLIDMLQNDKSRTYAFAVSTSAMANEIKLLEDVVDNLMFTRMEESMKLFLKIERMKEVIFSGKEAEVPIPATMLKEISEIAEMTRKTRIPEIRKI